MSSARVIFCVCAASVAGGGGGGGGGIAAAWSAAFVTATTGVAIGGLPPRSLFLALLPILLGLEGFPALLKKV
jgi:hypothetical protein